MADVYVSVDVESTATVPARGELLTVGCLAYHGETLRCVGDFYVRLRSRSEMVARHHHDPEWPTEGPDRWRWDTATRQWWESQHKDVFDEAVADGSDRMFADDAAKDLIDWLGKLPGKPVFVAHPVGFDWAWVNEWLIVHGGVNPFGYRPLCLRTLAWATGDTAEWGKDRAADSAFDVRSTTPHHAFHDAKAQGQTLVKVLRSIREERLLTPADA